MIRRSILAVALSLSFCAAGAAQSIQTGGMQVRFLGSRGYGLSIEQIPFSRASSLQLYAPGWKQGYYSSRGDHATADRQGDALIITHTGRKVDFAASETIRAAAPDRIEIILKGKLSSNVDARLEWGIGIINTYALYGGQVTAGASSPSTKIVPEPSSKRDPESLIGQGDAAHIATRFGQIDVKVEQGPKELVLLDGRRNPSRGWTQDQPSMWLGMLAMPVKPNQPFEYRVSIQFHPQKHAAAQADVIVDAKSTATNKAFVPTSRKLRIIPTPKKLKLLEGTMTIGPKARIIIGVDSARPAAQLLQREIKDRFDWDWTIKHSNDAPAGSIVIGPASDQGRKNLKPESYRLDCDGKSLRITGTTPGYRYGVETLLQLIRADSEGVSIPACQIDDYPTLAFRGVHLFTGKDAVDFYRTLADRVLARFKFNHVVLECDYTQWDADKKIWIDQSVPKSQIRDYVKISRADGLEPIPLVQSLGHSEWMFRNGQNLDLAEDPKTPYAYAVTNPKTYDFIHKVYDEAIELFDHPKYFHIGHDEVDMLGRYPQREDAKKLGKSKLFDLDVQRLENFFKPKRITMMLWGDELISKQEVHDGAANAPNPEEAKKRRDGVPKDAIICDWHYQPADPADFNSLKIFHDAGFKTIACTWYNPVNIYDFAAAARMYHAWGLLQTTWAGYHITADTLDREARQFSAYILAAEYAWNGDAPAPDKLQWRAEEVLAEAMGPQRQSIRTLAGELIPIGGSGLGDLLGYADLSALAGKARIGGIQFNISGAQVVAGELLDVQSSAPRKVTLKMNLKASELAFLQATAFPAAPGAEVGQYEITYRDGSHDRIELIYGRDIRAWTDLNPAAGAPAGWFGKTANGTPGAVRIFRWRNPHPEKAIASIGLSSRHAYASPILFGVTALN